MADFSVDANIHGGPITSDVTSELTGLDDMKMTLAGGTTTTLAGENTVHSDARITLEPVTSTTTVDLRPVTTTSLVTTTSSLDLQPVAVDSCVRLELAPPPATDVSTPYEQSWTWSVLGLEMFSLTVRGVATTRVRPEHHGPTTIAL